MVDNFSSYQESLDSPANGIFEITPNDSSDLSQVTRGLLVGTAGGASVVMADGTSGTIPLQVGYNPLQVKKINATDTTASNIWGLI